MLRFALALLLSALVLAACATFGQPTAEPRDGGGNSTKVDEQTPNGGTRTYAQGVLKVGETVTCGPGGIGAAVPAAGEGVHGVFDGVNPSSIDVVHKKSGVVIVRCGI
jgi:hypothetical protein